MEDAWMYVNAILLHSFIQPHPTHNNTTSATGVVVFVRVQTTVAQHAKGETLEGFFPLVDFPTMLCCECLLRMRHRAPIPSAIIWDRIGNRVRKIMPMELLCRVCGVYRPFLWTEWRWCGMLDPNYFWEGGCFSFLTFDRGLRRIKSWKWDIFLSKCVSPFS